MALRMKTDKTTTKISVGLSFSGDKGYEAFDYLKEARKFGYNKSTLVVELLLLLKKYDMKYGKEGLKILLTTINSEK